MYKFTVNNVLFLQIIGAISRDTRRHLVKQFHSKNENNRKLFQDTMMQIETRIREDGHTMIDQPYGKVKDPQN